MALLDQQCGWTRNALCRALKAKLPERAKPFTAALLRFSQGIDACSDRWPLQDTFAAPPAPELLGVRYTAFTAAAPASHFHALLPAKSPRSLLNPPYDPSAGSKMAGNRLFKAKKNRTGFSRIDRRVFLQPESIDSWQQGLRGRFFAVLRIDEALLRRCGPLRLCSTQLHQAATYKLLTLATHEWN